jgi:hypothetical protein
MEAARAQAFHDVFVFATWIGFIAVIFCLIEWWRRRNEPKSNSASSEPAA